MSGVYVMSDGEFCKIGRADNAHARRQDLQVGNARRLYLVFWLEASFVEAPKIERAAHEALSHLRRVGEWFACSDHAAIWAILSSAYPGCAAATRMAPPPEPDRVVIEGRFNKTAYQKEYMRKRREADRLKADKGTKKL